MNFGGTMRLMMVTMVLIVSLLLTPFLRAADHKEYLCQEEHALIDSDDEEKKEMILPIDEIKLLEGGTLRELLFAYEQASRAEESAKELACRTILMQLRDNPSLFSNFKTEYWKIKAIRQERFYRSTSLPWRDCSYRCVVL